MRETRIKNDRKGPRKYKTQWTKHITSIMKSIIVIEIHTGVALNGGYKDLWCKINNNVSAFGLFTPKFANRMDAQKHVPSCKGYKLHF